MFSHSSVSRVSDTLSLQSFSLASVDSLLDDSVFDDLSTESVCAPSDVSFVDHRDFYVVPRLSVADAGTYISFGYSHTDPVVSPSPVVPRLDILLMSLFVHTKSSH